MAEPTPEPTPQKQSPAERDAPPATSLPTPEQVPGDLPVGAILITSFLAMMILISWFGMYFLDFLRG